MGLFDSVYVNCPHCEKPVEFQTKEWNCDMTVYRLDTAPTPILYDIMNDPHHCKGCNGWFALVDPAFPPGPRPRPDLKAAKVKPPELPEKYSSWTWWPENKPFTTDDLQPEDGGIAT